MNHEVGGVFVVNVNVLHISPLSGQQINQLAVVSPVAKGGECHRNGGVLLHVLGALVELLAELSHVQTQGTQGLSDRRTRLG